MKLVVSEDIRRIDEYAENTLNIPRIELMAKSGEAIARVIRERIPEGKSILILAGKGNNGGDGYATATVLADTYPITIYDVFGEGQVTEEGKYHLARALEKGIDIEPYMATEKQKEKIQSVDCIIDAIFGTGFHGELPENIVSLAILLQKVYSAKKIAIDVPLGANADNGSVFDECIKVSTTVALSYIKVGTLSYPACAFVGDIVLAPLDLPSCVEEVFEHNYFLTDGTFAEENLPVRPKNSNKGTFGKLRIIAGSERYRGAASLALSSALRSGVGLCEYCGPKMLIDTLFPIYPEAIYRPFEYGEALDALVSEESRFNATLIGSGSDHTDKTLATVLALMDTEGAPLILDADAINVLASLGEAGREKLKNARRPIILTPHPLEFARLCGLEVSYVQLHRMEVATAFAKEYGVILVLKGAGTLMTDGHKVYINHSGSSALAKAGSGDVLAGALASLVAMGTEPLVASALAVYLHGVAADALSRIYSTYGVTPSDLPLEMAKAIAQIENNR